MSLAVEASLDLAALRHNLRKVREAAPGRKVMAVIKANGYGHGLERVAYALSEADAFAVARINEALQLRRVGILHPIVVLEGFIERADLEAMAHYQLQPVVHHPFQLELLAQNQLGGAGLQVWLKVDSGMHRLGFPAADVQAVWQRLRDCRSVSNIRLMTHLASADDLESPQTDDQLNCFDKVLEGLSVERSIANSAAILGWPASHGDWVRPGIMLYGISPFVRGIGADHGLKPVMTLRSHLIAINHFKAGDPIGYGASWVCPEDMPVGVVACGYGDGYPRHAVPGTPVLVDGCRASLVGRVSMDTLCVDLRQCRDAEIGAPVVLWGNGLPAEEVAAHASTIAYELLCGVTGRVRIKELS